MAKAGKKARRPAFSRYWAENRRQINKISRIRRQFAGNPERAEKEVADYRRLDNMRYRTRGLKGTTTEAHSGKKKQRKGDS